MLKPLYLTIVIIPIAAEAALSPALRAQSLYPPQVSGSVADTLVCYMQTSDGRLLQLESFCQGEVSTGTGRQTNSSNAARQSFRNGSSSRSSGSFPNSSNQVNSPNQDDPTTNGPAETAVCAPANSPECSDVDFSSAAPDFVPDTSPAPVSQ